MPLRCWPVIERIGPRLARRLVHSADHLRTGRHWARHVMPVPSPARPPITIKRLVCRDVPDWLKNAAKAAALSAPIALTSPPVAPPVQPRAPAPPLALPGPSVPAFVPSAPAFGPFAPGATESALPPTSPPQFGTARQFALPLPSPPVSLLPSPPVSVPGSGPPHTSPLPEPPSETTFVVGSIFLICLRVLASRRRR
jgi:hypothetical protein